MAVGLSAYLANKILDHATGRASFTMPSGVYAKMHTGDPGASATSAAFTPGFFESCSVTAGD